MKTSLLFLTAVLIADELSSAQAIRPTFEVASIKPSKTNEPWFWDITPGGRMVGRNITVKRLLILAYRLQEFQIGGGPGWVSKDQFDIEAKPEAANTTGEQSRLMLRTLLQDRFRLSVHLETKDGPVYILEVVKDGPPLSADQSPPAPQPGPAPDGSMPRGAMPRGAMRMRQGIADGKAVPISLLIRYLSQTMGRPVIDKTNLAGRYNIDLHWIPNETAQNPPGTPIPPTDAPSLFTAVQERLGLKLVSATAPIERLVVERVEKPTAN